MPGDTIKLTRRYYDHDWHLGLFNMLLTDPELPPLSFAQAGDTIDSIELDSLTYDAAGQGLWVYGTELQIARTDTGFRWQNKYGGWRDYNEAGYLTSFGGTFDTTATILYDADYPGRIVGVANRDDIQVLWFDYNADGLIAAIRDIDDRRVTYEYTDGLLSRVVDLNDNETLYGYDDQGRLNRTVGADGRESLVEYNIVGMVTANTDRYGNTYRFDYDYDDLTGEYYTMAETPTGIVTHRPSRSVHAVRGLSPVSQGRTGSISIDLIDLPGNGIQYGCGTFVFLTF